MALNLVVDKSGFSSWPSTSPNGMLLAKSTQNQNMRYSAAIFLKVTQYFFLSMTGWKKITMISIRKKMSQR